MCMQCPCAFFFSATKLASSERWQTLAMATTPAQISMVTNDSRIPKLAKVDSHTSTLAHAAAGVCLHSNEQLKWATCVLATSRVTSHATLAHSCTTHAHPTTEAYQRPAQHAVSGVDIGDGDRPA